MPSEEMWAVIEPNDGLESHTIRWRRDQSIAAAVESSVTPDDWPDWESQGYRCQRVTVTWEATDG